MPVRDGRAGIAAKGVGVLARHMIVIDALHLVVPPGGMGMAVAGVKIGIGHFFPTLSMPPINPEAVECIAEEIAVLGAGLTAGARWSGHALCR